MEKEIKFTIEEASILINLLDKNAFKGTATDYENSIYLIKKINKPFEKKQETEEK